MIPYTASSSLSTARWNCRFSGVGNHGGNTPSEAEPAMYAMASSMLVFTRSAAGPATEAPKRDVETMSRVRSLKSR